MQREADERSQDEEQERAASGHARDVDSEDAVDRVDTRLRHRAAHPDAVGGRADDRRGNAVSGAAADARQAMGGGLWTVTAIAVVDLGARRPDGKARRASNIGHMRARSNAASWDA